MARILITSAIPYINGIKHLGNLVGSQLPADLYARYLRQRGHEVLFICATDEHGTPAELAAQEAKMEVADYCEKMHTVQKDLADGFQLSFDHFGRSSSGRNHRLTQHFAGKLDENGNIREVEEDQIYSIDDKRFLPDRFVRGECPACGYDRARGDQCENCTKQLDPIDLINPRSEISGSTNLEMRKTKHLHLCQSAFIERLEEWINSKHDWPILTTSIAKKWLTDGSGLQDRGITRDLDWGVPVRKGTHEWPGMEGKVFYVWFDAPIEYIAATAEWADSQGLSDSEWLRWWRTDKGAEDVRYVQFMGKDNVPFHTLSFPVTIMGSGEPWKLVDYIKSFNFLNYDGGQFSTSLGRGIFMDKALELLPPDYWRWWLLSHAPEYSDSEFTWDEFVSNTNKDLADVLGNFVRRITTFAAKHFDSEVPEHEFGEAELNFVSHLENSIRHYETQMDAIEIRKAARELRSIWSTGNEFLQSTEPWKMVREDKNKAAASVALCLNLVRVFAILSQPFVPSFSKSTLNDLNCSNSDWPENVVDSLKVLKAGHRFNVPEVAFQKISTSQRDQWKEQFSGGKSS